MKGWGTYGGDVKQNAIASLFVHHLLEDIAMSQFPAYDILELLQELSQLAPKGNGVLVTANQSIRDWLTAEKQYLIEFQYRGVHERPVYTDDLGLTRSIINTSDLAYFHPISTTTRQAIILQNRLNDAITRVGAIVHKATEFEEQVPEFEKGDVVVDKAAWRGNTVAHPTIVFRHLTLEESHEVARRQNTYVRPDVLCYRIDQDGDLTFQTTYSTGLIKIISLQQLGLPVLSNEVVERLTTFPAEAPT